MSFLFAWPRWPTLKDPVIRSIQLSSIAAVLLLGVPWLPQLATDGLDSGWAYALGVALEQKLSFGRDIVFTYGPLGALVTFQYHEATYWLAVALWLATVALSMALVMDAHETQTRRTLREGLHNSVLTRLV